VSSPQADDAGRAAARKEIKEAMQLLDKLLAIGPTIERESIYGSAYKRLAMIEDAAGDPGKAALAIEQMKSHYAAAEKIALMALEADPAAPVDWFYPAMNRVAAEIALGSTRKAGALDVVSLVEKIRQSMAALPPKFYTVVGQTELSVYASILAGTFAKDVHRFVEEFTAHSGRVSAVNMWGSVYENAAFVLTPWARQAGTAERAAVGVLLSVLAPFAGQTYVATQPAPRAPKAARPQPRPKARDA
jgi:tetratricopeptide (TPR) repeat protein